MKKSVSPISVRVLSIVSVALSLLWGIAYVACIAFQRDIKIMQNAPEEIINLFVIPLAPLLQYGLIFLVQAVFAILIVAFWGKAVWSKGITVTVLIVDIVLLAANRVFGGLIATMETLMVGQIRGHEALASLGLINGILSHVGGFATASTVCMIIALSILAFRSCTDAKRSRG